MIKVLSVTSECVPLVKTGGLADVAGALPEALHSHGVEMRTLLPGYRQVMSQLQKFEIRAELNDVFGASARLLAAKHADLDLLILDAPHLYDRDGGIYLDPKGKDWDDNAERYAALCRVAADIAGGLIPDWTPEIMHCHDWQAGLVPYYVQQNKLPTKTVMTVHNIAFQGITSASKLKELGIAKKDFKPEGLEYYGRLSTLKAGLVYADQLTTVSPTYAEELMRPEFGMGLDGVLHMRRDDFVGILNGVDESVWSPEVDKEIITYKTPAGKARNKAALQKEFNLPKSDGPLCVVVSRLSEQKGFDLLIDALPTLLARSGQLALLGSGDMALEKAFQDINHPNVSVHIGYDEALSHRMVAGGDAILVPSRFEPCGLTQLYGLRYGTIPLVALTGGLADTIIPATPATLAKEVATGLQFYPILSQSMSNALARLCDLYAQPKLWLKLQKNAMTQPVSWDRSASAYAKLYRDLL